MYKRSGWVLAGLLAVLGAVHVYWACGGRRGWNQVLPTRAGERLFTPPTPAIWAVTLGLFGAAGVALGRTGVWGRSVPPALFRWSVRGLGVAFACRAVGDFDTIGLTKRVRDTSFARWDTRLYSPLCIAMAVLAALADRSLEQG